MQPSIVLVDQLDQLFPDRQSAEEKLKAIQVYSLLESLPPNAILLGTVSREIEFDAYEYEVVFSSRPQRRSLLKRVFGRFGTCLTDKMVDEFAAKTPGYTPADLLQVVRDAVVLYERDPSNSLEAHVLDSICRNGPSGMRESHTAGREIEFGDLVGIDDIVERLQDMMLRSFTQSSSLSKYGLPVPKGILIWGPTGSGKTSVALAFAKSSGMNIIVSDLSQLRSKFVGETEKNVRKLFSRARFLAPCIILIEQIEDLARGESELSKRSLACFSSEMDGFLAGGGNVLVVATTCSLGLVDPSLLRPGRFDIRIEMPEFSGDLRRRLFEKEIRKRDISLTPEEIDTIVDRLEGFSAAEVLNVVREAIFTCLRRDIGRSHVMFSDFLAE